MNSQTQDIAIGGTFVVLLILSAFDTTGPYALMISILLFAIVWISAYENGTLNAAVKGIIG